MSHIPLSSTLSFTHRESAGCRHIVKCQEAELNKVCFENDLQIVLRHEFVGSDEWLVNSDRKATVWSRTISPGSEPKCLLRQMRLKIEK